MALDNCYTCYDDGHFVLPPPPPQMDWDFWELELHALVGGDVARDGIHEGAIPAMLGVQSLEESSESSEASSGGYLQDAVAHWGDRCKRQRMAPEAEAAPRRPAEATNEDLHCLLQRFWDSSGGGGGGEGGHLFHDLNIMIPECDGSFVSGEDNASGWEQEQGQGGPSAAASAAEAVQVSAEQSGGEAAPLPSTSSASSRTATTGQDAAPQLQPQKATSAGAAHAAAQPGRRGNNSSSCAEEAERVVAKQRRQPSSSPRAASASPRSSLTGKEKRDTGVLYPFAVVKPLGLEGGGAATLDDVNQRILKRPARPVRHPVGQFACSPAVYAHGLGQELNDQNLGQDNHGRVLFIHRHLVGATGLSPTLNRAKHNLRCTLAEHNLRCILAYPAIQQPLVPVY